MRSLLIPPRTCRLAARLSQKEKEIRSQTHLSALERCVRRGRASAVQPRRSAGDGDDDDAARGEAADGAAPRGDFDYWLLVAADERGSARAPTSSSRP